MTKLCKTAAGLCLAMLILLGVCACGQEQREIGGVPVTPEMLESVSRALAQAAATEEPVQTNTSYVTSTSTTRAETTSAETTATTVPTETIDDTAQTTAQTTTSHLLEESATTMQATAAVVYWTESGTVYHIRRDCSSFSNSTKILQGSIEEAILAEKERACKRCS